MNEPGVEVKASPVHGMGVFATRPWKSGELIGVYEGTITTDTDDDDLHTLWLQDEEGRYFGIVSNGDMGFLNHAYDDEHNAILAGNSPFIYARTNIKPGDEIFVSYGEDTQFGDDKT